ELSARLRHRELGVAELDDASDALGVPAFGETQSLGRVRYDLLARRHRRLGSAQRERRLLDVDPHLETLGVELRSYGVEVCLTLAHTSDREAALEERPSEGHAGVPGGAERVERRADLLVGSARGDRGPEPSFEAADGGPLRRLLSLEYV